MNSQGSGMTRGKTMTEIVGGELVLPGAWKYRKTSPKTVPLCCMNPAKVLQSSLHQKTFPQPHGQIRKSGLSNPHRLA